MTPKKFLVFMLIAYSSVSAAKFREDADTKVRISFQNRPRQDVSKVILELDSFSTIIAEDMSKIKINVQIKSGAGDEFRALEASQTKRMGRFTFSFGIIPCLQHKLQLVVEDDDGVDSVEVTIPQSSLEDIKKSSFKPEPVKNLEMMSGGGSGVHLTWDGSLCATHYEVTVEDTDQPRGGGSRIIKTQTSTETQLDILDLPDCGHFLISVLSFIGDDKFGDDFTEVSVSTPPSASSSDKLEPNVTRGQDSVKITWAYNSLSCVSSYLVTLKPDDADLWSDPVHVEMDNSLPFVEFTEFNLKQCTDYIAKIEPVFDGQQQKSKLITFRTLSPGVDDVGSSLSVSAAPGVLISWSRVECAQEYRVYQQLVTGHDERWELVTTTPDTEASVSGIPCSAIKYGVKALIDDHETALVEAPEIIETPLEGTEYSAPNLHIVPSTESVSLTWDHAQCILEYSVSVCKTGGEEVCHHETLSPASPHLTTILESLSPCSEYSLQISALTSDTQLSPDKRVFTTQSPAPATPENLVYHYHELTNTPSLTWEPITCATSYKIFRLQNEEEIFLDEIRDNKIDIADTTPCSDVRLAVAAVVGDEEGSKTEFTGGVIPPSSEGERSKPGLELVDEFNRTVVFKLVLPDINKNCQAESYQVKYHNLGQDVEQLEETYSHLEDGTITLDNFPQDVDKGFQIEGRLKYKGFESWSPWTSSHSQDPKIVLENGNGIIVPIVIGALITTIILIVVIFFFVRRKNNSNKYNCDTNADNAAESEKLNEEA